MDFKKGDHVRYRSDMSRVYLILADKENPKEGMSIIPPHDFIIGADPVMEGDIAFPVEKTELRPLPEGPK